MSDPSVFTDWYSLLESFLDAAKRFWDPKTRVDWMVIVHEFLTPVVGLRFELTQLEQIDKIPRKLELALRQDLSQYEAYTTDKLSDIFDPQKQPRCAELCKLLEDSHAKILSLNGHKAEGTNTERKADSYTPTDWIKSAHDSMMKALTQCTVCNCDSAHDPTSAMYRIPLKTHRQFPETVCAVSMFVRAVDSWQETVITAKKTLANAGISIRVSDETDSIGSFESDYDTKIEYLCWECLEAGCKKCLKASDDLEASEGSSEASEEDSETSAEKIVERLHLMVNCDDGNCLFRGTSDLGEWKWIDAVSLQHLLERSDVRISTRAKSVLLLQVSYASLHFFDAFWSKDSWDSSRIAFPIKPAGICLTPYWQTRVIFLAATSTEDHQELNHVQRPRFLLQRSDPRGHPFPFLVVLAVLLLEIHEKQPFAALARHFKIQFHPKGQDHELYLAARDLYKCLKQEDSITWSNGDKSFFRAIFKCLEKGLWHKVTDEHDMRSRIYSHIVQNVQQYFTEYQGDLNEVDKFEDTLPLPDELQLMENFPISDASSGQKETAQLPTSDPIRWQSDTAMAALADETAVKRSQENIRNVKDTQIVRSRSPLSLAVGQVDAVRFNTKGSNVSILQRSVNKALEPVATSLSPFRVRFFNDNDYPQPQYKIDSAMKWKSDYLSMYNAFLRSDPGRQLDDYHSIVCTDERESNNRVKIAVIDTGYDLKHLAFREAKLPLMERNPITKQCCSTCLDSWTDCEPAHMHDEIGHGTHVAGLLLNFAKDAELHIIKLEGIKGTELELNSRNLRRIARALDVAALEWKVDIISISFGWSETATKAYDKDPAYIAYQKAIESASNKALIFAAATNEGPNVGRAWPARELGVFCIHSTDGNGTWSEINPLRWDSKTSLNLAVLGEAVESYWTCPANERVKMTKKTRSGTSYAAPIAASIAAFLIMFGQKYLREEEAAKLKHFHEMNAVLEAVCNKSVAKGHTKLGDFHYLHLSLESDNLFGKSSDKIIKTIEDALRGRG